MKSASPLTSGPFGSRSPALFTRHERALIAILVTFLSGLAAPAMMSFSVSGENGHGDQSVIDRILKWIDLWLPGADEIGKLFSVGLVWAVPVVIFVVARRSPRLIVIGLVWFTATYLCLMLCFTPAWIVHANQEFLAAVQEWELGSDPALAILQIPSLFAPYVLASLLVVGTGEFAGLVRQRELRVATDTSAALGINAEDRAFRRERLLLSIMGPRMPVLLALARILTFLFIPVLVVWSITEFDAGKYRRPRELALSPTLLQRATLPSAPRPFAVTIDAEGVVKVDGVNAGTGSFLPLRDYLKSRHDEGRQVWYGSIRKCGIKA